MINNILNSYRFKGQLRRIPFVLSFLILSIVTSYISYLFRQAFLGLESGGDHYLTASFIAEILVAFAIFPLCAARLRDIGWSQFLAVLILLSPLLSPRLMIIAALNSFGFISSSYWYSGFNLIGSVVLLLFIFSLMVLKGGNRAELAEDSE